MTDPDETPPREPADLTPRGVFGSIVEDGAEGALVLLADGSVGYLNAAAERLFGRSREQIVGDLLGVPSVGRGATEVCVVGDDRSLRYLRLIVRPLPEAGLGARLVTLTDVTGYRADREQALAEADRLSRFLAVLSHEVRNPLGTLQSAFELLKMHPKSDPTYRRAQEIAEGQFGQLRGLLADLLDLSRVTQDKMRLRTEPLDLAGLVSDAVEAIRAEADESGHAVALRRGGPVPWVDGDRTRLTQAAGNLLGNALRYTPPGSRIEVAVRAAGEAALIEVSDDGPGVAVGLLPRLFEPFAQADDSLDRTDSGLGIGLALVRRIAELHGGKASAANLDSGGCRFTVELPRCEPGDCGEDEAPDAGGSAVRVLLAEDNADLRMMMTLLLKRFDYDVTGVADGEAAVAAFEADPPDVAVLDIGLPKLTGLQAAKRLRAGGSTVPLLALTGYGRSEDREEALAAGFDEHLTKPPDFDKLRAAIERLIANRG